jgi:pimeloyl-ACP methyl ester carboxylesterase
MKDEGHTKIRTSLMAINGSEIHCDEIGEEGAGELPLVLVHGFTGHREDFREVLEQGRDLGWVLAPDLRGHGDATHTGDPSTYDFAALVDDLRALLDLREISACHLLGHSMGGMVTLRFALAHPERVASLILMNTAPNCPDQIVPASLARAAEIAMSQGMSALQVAAEKSTRQRDPQTKDAEYLERWADRYWAHHRKRYCAMDPVAYAELSRAMCEQDSVVARLSEIACPTTVIVGEGDVPFLDGSHLLANRIPNARFARIPDAGHHPQQENPVSWNEALRSHLAIAEPLRARLLVEEGE